jgi:hypothetical protein
MLGMLGAAARRGLRRARAHRGRESFVFRTRGVSRSAMLSISAFRAKFGLGVIWLSAVSAGNLFRVATPLVPGEPVACPLRWLPL